jgi:hypothetical protein
MKKCGKSQVLHFFDTHLVPRQHTSTGLKLQGIDLIGVVIAFIALLSSGGPLKGMSSSCYPMANEVTLTDSKNTMMNGVLFKEINAGHAGRFPH